jgi:uncharacterized protein (TIGR02466 family)
MNNPILQLIFPTTIYKDKVDFVLDEDARKAIESKDYILGHNGTFSDFNYRYLDQPMFLNLKNELQKHLDFYAKEVFKYESVEVYITQSWINVNPTKSSHTVHNHSNSVFSGVYYIDVPEGAPFLQFYSPIKHMFSIEPKEWNMHNSATWTIPVCDNDVLIFPSTLEHEVLENKSDKTRLSIAFNSFIKGEIGEVSGKGSNYQIIK